MIAWRVCKQWWLPSRLSWVRRRDLLDDDQRRACSTEIGYTMHRARGMLVSVVVLVVVPLLHHGGACVAGKRREDW